ncbi:hypothetical protein KIPB_000074 [Kipferlia bialata]|uniref:Uncharacterized protein n=1 Tax=Kipferlia bialata TaxID=797122 RepID=A0A9K3CPW0_9EUKA|nr:hypothetical protein KIPB_000074 [Kipferlia bialata]|eukprot:g74.t1
MESDIDLHLSLAERIQIFQRAENFETRWLSLDLRDFCRESKYPECLICLSDSEFQTVDKAINDLYIREAAILGSDKLQDSLAWDLIEDETVTIIDDAMTFTKAPFLASIHGLLQQGIERVKTGGTVSMADCALAQTLSKCLVKIFRNCWDQSLYGETHHSPALGLFCNHGVLLTLLEFSALPRRVHNNQMGTELDLSDIWSATMTWLIGILSWPTHSPARSGIVHWLSSNICILESLILNSVGAIEDEMWLRIPKARMMRDYNGGPPPYVPLADSISDSFHKLVSLLLTATMSDAADACQVSVSGESVTHDDSGAATLGRAVRGSITLMTCLEGVVSLRWQFWTDQQNN